MAVSGTSSSLSSMLGVKNKGIGGLVSGLDTDSLVEALTAGTRSKIAKQGQDRQLLNWKISAYRTMSSSLKAFQGKTLSYSASSNTNISSQAFFNTYKATSSSSNVSVTASSNSQTGSFTIDSVQQLATSESLASKMTLSPELTIDLTDSKLKAGAFTGQTLSIDVGSTGKAKTINLDSLNDAFDIDGKLNMGEVQSKLQELLKDTFGTYKDKDGIQKSIVQVTLKEDGKLKLDSESSKIEIAETNTLLGVKENQSNRLSLNTKLGDIGSLKGLEGNQFKFQINGVEISATRDDTLQSLITKIKSSAANVNISYSEHTDEITLTAKSSGAGKNINISDVQGNLMSEIFGAKSGGTVGSSYLLTNEAVVSQDVNAIAKLEEKYKDDPEGLTKAMKELGKNLKNMEFNVTINGVTKLVKLDTSAMDSKEISEGTFSFNDIIAGMNKGIKNSFSGTEVMLTINGDGTTGLYTPDANTSISIAPSTKSVNFDGAALFGFTEKVSNVKLDFGNETSVASTSMMDMDALRNLESGDIGTFSVTINGVTKQIGVSGLADSKDPAALLNNAIKAAFGNNTGVTFKSETITEQVQAYKKDEDGKLLLDGDNKPILAFEEDGETPIMETITKGYKLSLNVADSNTSVTLDHGVNIGNRIDIYKELGFSDIAPVKMVDQAALDAIDPGKYGTLSVTLNGETKEIGIPGLADSENQDKLDELLNAAIRSAFGDSADGVTFTLEDVTDEGGNPGYKLTLEVTDPKTSISFNHGKIPGDDRVDMYDALGFGSNLVNNSNPDYEKGTKFSDLYAATEIKYDDIGVVREALKDGYLLINEEVVKYSSDMKIQDFIDKVNSALGGKGYAGVSDGKLTITALDGKISIEEIAGVDGDGKPILTGEKGNMLSNIFGISSGKYVTQDQEFGVGKHKEGQNAEFIIDGKVISRASNTVDYNGATITLNKVSSPDDAPITIDVKSDPEEVITRLKAWMDDYNALVFTLNSAINESKNSDYFPLTDEQKADMTQDQIKTWETEAKKGLLRNDQTLKGILSDMRTSMFEKVEAAGISLFDIGITTKGYTGDPNEAGQLQFDTNVKGGGEAKLRSMLENDPDRVRLLFTDTTNGIAMKINTVIEAATRTSSTNRGSLVDIAGTESLTGNNTSVLGKKISALDKYVTALKIRMEDEYNRQWKKFSALEVAVQRMSAQSSWLSQ